MMGKEKWEIAVDKFLESWPHRKDTVAVAICGSYVTGNPSNHSDIDLQIILSDKVNWRERGNKIIDGFLIEYFANPIKQIKKYFEEEFNGRKQYTSHMIYTGKIVFDDGTFKGLKKSAKKYLGKNFNRCNKDATENHKYHIWDTRDNLQEIYESHSEDFNFVYFNSLKSILDMYLDFIGYPGVAVHKVLRFLSSEKDIKKYHLKKFPDNVFKDLFIQSLKEENKDKKMKIFNELTEYTLKKMGGFNLDGWKLKGELK